MTVKGTKGNDTLKGTANADIFDLSQGGNDTASGLAGNDTFQFGATFTAKDSINGGAGTDVLSLAGDYSHGVVFGATTVVGVETITLGVHHDYKLTTNDANVAKNKTLTVDGSKLAAADTLTFNGSHETNGHFDIIGGKGNDVLADGAQADTFTLTAGGNDTANGGAGNDTFNLAAALTAADKINGGVGADVLNLNGTYTGAHALAFGAKTVVGVDKMVLAAGHSYALTTADATVPSGANLIIDASALGASNGLAFNGSAETDGHFEVTGGAGNDSVTFARAAVFAGSMFDGGAGDDMVHLNAAFNGNLTGAMMMKVETLILGAGHNYNIVEANTAVAAGKSLTVDASALSSGDVLSLKASAETNGALTIIGGAGNDHLVGGQFGNTFDLSHGGNDTATGGGISDTFNMGATFTAADRLDGGTDLDFLNLDGNTNVTMTATTIQNIEWISLGGGHDYNLTLNGNTIAAGQTLNIDANDLQDGDHLTLDASAVADGIVDVLGINTHGIYDITGGAGNDLIDLADGDASTRATIHGSLGGDAVYGAAAEGGMTTFIYTDPTQSTGEFFTHDLLRFVHFNTDKMEVSGFTDTGGFTYAGNTATINSANFDADLAAAISGHLNANGVCEVIAGGGDENGHAYLVLDINGDASYTNGQDYVFEIDNSDTGAITSSFFT
ncbi:MAG TPA: hypothetical protein VHW02_09950 [Rhizomicrobium sp.]|jgi:hypothetical protein|nr:hypothetical protein [Rhizomicrobium sp.]